MINLRSLSSMNTQNLKYEGRLSEADPFVEAHIRTIIQDESCIDVEHLKHGPPDWELDVAQDRHRILQVTKNPDREGHKFAYKANITNNWFNWLTNSSQTIRDDGQCIRKTEYDKCGSLTSVSERRQWPDGSEEGLDLQLFADGTCLYSERQRG